MPTKPKNGSKEPIRDRCQTPSYALAPLVQWLSPTDVVWEPCKGEGYLLNALMPHVGRVICGDVLTGQDYFAYEPPAYTIQVTNPPFSLKYKWLARAYELGKPFALLMPIDVLGAKSGQRLFEQHGVQVILMAPRVDYSMPNQGWGGRGAQFSSAWFCWGMGIGRTLTFADISVEKRAFVDEMRNATREHQSALALNPHLNLS